MEKVAAGFVAPPVSGAATVRGPQKCRKCRIHDMDVLKKGHKNCPYAQCTCQKCVSLGRVRFAPQSPDKAVPSTGDVGAGGVAGGADGGSAGSAASSAPGAAGVDDMMDYQSRFPPSHTRILKPLPAAVCNGLGVARDAGQICICIAKAIGEIDCLLRAALCTWDFQVANKGGAVGRGFTHARSCCSCLLDCVASHTVNHKTARRQDHPAPKQEGQVLCDA